MCRSTQNWLDPFLSWMVSQLSPASIYFWTQVTKKLQPYLEYVGVYKNYLILYSCEWFLSVAQLVFFQDAVTKKFPNLECVGVYKNYFVNGCSV
jgi:hypothetical protein